LVDDWIDGVVRWVRRVACLAGREMFWGCQMAGDGVSLLH